MRRIAIGCLLALFLAVPALGSGTPAERARAIYADYVLDLRIDAAYTPEDLRRALTLTAGYPGFAEFEEAARRSLDERYLGVSGRPPSSAVGGELLALGRSQSLSEQDSVPGIFPVLCAAGGLLIIAGVVSRIIGRVRLRRGPSPV
ncbi:hypothetical protein [Miltoncostaea oceani]|uniref:hypothetical protein n=1 Tax=Miltoncostaea oceani TaxID=2843216 RepID=UPI001C3DDB44|nr:hypothetical protein [Miltoncostaea oceani]